MNMHAEDVLELYTLLLEDHVQIWLDGGWGIDALVGQQTRPHKDLDAFVAFDDLPALAETLYRRGFRLKEIWSENRWRGCDVHVPLIGTGEFPGQVATAFVLVDTVGRELDFHVMDVDEHGSGVPAWDCDLTFPPDALQGQGVIAGVPVRCLTAAMHLQTHRGYELQEKDKQDLRWLRERFGIGDIEETASDRMRLRE